MHVYDVHVAKTKLSRLIEQACAGEEVVIARDNVPAVKLVPIQPRPKPQRGSLKGQIVVQGSCFDPISDEELADWGME